MAKFPDKYRHKVDSISDDGLSMKLFAEIHDIDNCVEWVTLYGQLTNSRWIVSRSKDDGGKYVCRNKKLKKKNFDCSASINIIVKYTNKMTRYRYQHVKDNLPAIITINLQHSHDTESAEVLTSLAPSSATFDRFQGYFDRKMGVAKAIREHAAFLKEEFGDVDKLMVNGIFNPKPRMVAHWYERWRKKHLSDTTAVLPLGDKADTAEYYNAFENNPNSEQLSFSSSTSIQQPLSSSSTTVQQSSSSTTVQQPSSPSSTTNQQSLSSYFTTIQQPLTSSILIEQLPSTSECIHNVIAPVQDYRGYLNSFREAADKLLNNLPMYYGKKIISEIEKCKNPSDYMAIADCFSERKLIRKHYRAPINVQPRAVSKRRSGFTRNIKILTSRRPRIGGCSKED
ncbi:uncharacterized protein LOC143913546 isoform X2 [Arctopsyche grandis]|uniref:uncharacterized protein LOC143913546 isoform X2 n=1 Tax=Arctopsyche grandis TaxID=121162 RepID=UPI00406D66DC